MMNSAIHTKAPVASFPVSRSTAALGNSRGYNRSVGTAVRHVVAFFSSRHVNTGVAAIQGRATVHWKTGILVAYATSINSSIFLIFFFWWYFFVFSCFVLDLDVLFQVDFYFMLQLLCVFPLCAVFQMCLTIENLIDFDGQYFTGLYRHRKNKNTSGYLIVKTIQCSMHTTEVVTCKIKPFNTCEGAQWGKNGSQNKT